MAPWGAPIAVVLTMWALAPTPAHADPKDDARRRFQQGVELARGGELEQAIALFLEADALFRHPATTYNLAFAYQKMGNTVEALRWYRTLREQAPDRAAEIDPIVASLEADLAARQAALAAPPVVSGEGGAALASAEIERLRAIAAELEQLAAAVARRGPGPSVEEPSVPPPDPEPTNPDTGPVVSPPDAGFEQDAYERVVITASRYGQDPVDSPSTVSILTADDIRLSGAADIAEVLRRVVGVDVMSMSAGQPEVSIRGFNRELNNKVLVLIDGRSVYWDFIGTTQWAGFPISLEEIERIEVIRGPGSAVYGANAVTGVVNVITKTPGEDPETLVRLDAGSPGYLRGTAMTTGRSAQTSWRFSAGYQQQGRWARAEDVGDGSAVVPFLDDPDIASRHVRANGRVDRALGSEGFLSLSGGYADGVAEIYNIGVLGNYGRETTDAHVRADLTAGPVHGRVFYNRVEGRTGPWTASPLEALRMTSAFVAQTLDGEVEGFATFQTGSLEHRVNGGVGYRRKAIDNFRYLESDIVENHFNAFVNEEATVGPVKLVASLRADRHPLIDLDKTLSPRGAAIVRIAEDRSVRVSGGTAFRVPTLVESYMDIGISTDVDGVVIQDFGSRDLVPERVITAEAGFHDASTLYHTADVTLYYNRVSDLIGLGPLSPTLGGYDPRSQGYIAGVTGWENLPDVYHGVGVEADARLFPVDGLDVFTNVAIQQVFRDTPGEEVATDGSSSLLKVNVGAQYRTPYRFDISGSAHISSAQTWTLREFDESGNIALVDQAVPARAILVARAALRPFPDDDLEIGVSGWNLAALLDGLRVREHPKGQPVGARVAFSLAYRF